MDWYFTTPGVKYIIEFIVGVIGIPSTIGYTGWNILMYNETHRGVYRHNFKTGIIGIFCTLTLTILFAL